MAAPQGGESPGTAMLLAAMDATWPPAALHPAEGWLVREGRGGGNRVSCITRTGEGADIALAEAAARRLGQVPIFRLAPGAAAGDAALDAELAARGYRIDHPVAFHAAPVARLAVEPPPISAFTIWPPLAIQRQIWAETGTGPARLAIMERAPAPKAALLGRSRDKSAGAGFVAVAGPVAMLHALAVRPDLRRLGTARHMLGRAALWAGEAGAQVLALAVEVENAGAIALYEAAGMDRAGGYHYRVPAAG